MGCKKKLSIQHCFRLNKPDKSGNPTAQLKIERGVETDSGTAFAIETEPASFFSWLIFKY